MHKVSPSHEIQNTFSNLLTIRCLSQKQHNKSLFLKQDKSHFKYPIPLSFALAYTPQTLVNYIAIMSNSQYSSPDSYSSYISSTRSSVSRLSKSSERHDLRFSSLRSSASPLVR